ncbi:glycosyltransferase [Candidatus Uhrbacteria bacterium]|nr:glycosyltransferase [Candidatus Uhrbacteria bacterium]
MKIAIGMHIQEGAFGGGNQFGKLLTQYLREHGHEVFFDLHQPDLDLILMTDPRTSLSSVAFGPLQIMRYVHDINPSVLLVQRVNECDERKGTHRLNRLLSAANEIMDHTIFISAWLEQLHRKQNPFTKNISVIKNGGDRSIFTYQKKHLPMDRKIRLVTHHWSANWNKGWDVYMHLDHLLATTNLGEQLEFTYIGNVPAKTPLKAIHVIPPLSGAELAQELHRHDVYISASLNEPAGMHHIEATLCGLPILFRISGALPEYCQDYGVGFEGPKDVEVSLTNLLNNYDFYTQQLERYPFSSEAMCHDYIHLFEQLISQKTDLLPQRSHRLFLTSRQFNMRLKLTWLSWFN